MADVAMDALETRVLRNEVLQLEELESIMQRVGPGLSKGDARKLWEGTLGKGFSLAKRAGAGVGRAFENNARLAVMLDQMAKGIDPETAAMVVKRHLFDPEQMTQFERNVMRRIIPFYSWMRFNIPLQLETLITQPGRQAAFFDMFNAASAVPSAEFADGLPVWTRRQLVAGLEKNDNGTVTLLYGMGLPIEDLARVPILNSTDTLLQAVGPMIRAPLDQIYRRSSFYSRPFELYGRKQKGPIPSVAQNLPESVQKWIGYTQKRTKDGRTLHLADLEKLNWLYSSPMSRVATTLKLAKDERISMNQFLLRFLFGPQVVEYDTAQSRAFRLQNQINRARQLQSESDTRRAAALTRRRLNNAAK